MSGVLDSESKPEFAPHRKVSLNGGMHRHQRTSGHGGATDFNAGISTRA
jgi:hypothetical protein